MTTTNANAIDPPPPRATGFALSAGTLLVVGFMIGVNVMTGHWFAAAAVAAVGVANTLALVHLYRSSMRLIRVQERLRRQGNLPQTWPPMPPPGRNPSSPIP